MTFAYLAIHHPKPEHLEDVVASMHRVDAAAAAMPGLINIGPWRADDGVTLVGISQWQSRAAFEAASSAMFEVVRDDPWALWTTSPPDSYFLESD